MFYKNFVLSVFLLGFLCANCQLVNKKPIIDANSVNKWVKLLNDYTLSINSDGDYATYEIGNLPAGNSTLIIRSISTKWSDSIINGKKICFSGNGKYFLYQRGDTLFRMQLNSKRTSITLGIQSITKPDRENLDWIILTVKNKEGVLLYNCSTEKQFQYEKVSTCYFDPSGEALFLKSEGVKNREKTTELSVLFFSDLKKKLIFQSSKEEINNIAIYSGGQQIAFSTKELYEKKTLYSLWYHCVSLQSAKKIVYDSPDEISGLEFRKDGKFIFFNKTINKNTTSITPLAKVNVWNYLDSRTQQFQENYENSSKSKLTFAVNVMDSFYEKNPVQITSLNEKIWVSNTVGDYIVIAKFLSNQKEWLHYKDSLFLVSLIDGNRKILPFIFNWGTFISPSGRYIVYYDQKSQYYFSYDIQKDSCINISNAVGAGQFAELHEFILNPKTVYGAGWGEIKWVKNKDELYVYDNYDIWVLDATGQNPARSITNGYGKKNGIRFCIVDDNFMSRKENSKLLLVAFQKSTKFNGFFSKDLGNSKDPVKLVLGPYLFYYTGYLFPYSPNMYNSQLKPLKAENKNVWIVKRMGINSAPNYCVTSDFFNYKPISNIQPQSSYNWYISELRSWRRPDGIINQGILYKPENFDSTKKYPVIISYYASASQRLYDFPPAEFSNSAHINIPWFVSRGYLVLCPDIYLEEKRTNEGAYNSVKYAGEYLKNLSFVDSLHVGIAGHSRAGQYTNYIVSRTGMFAAAFEGAGTSDFVSSALQLVPDGDERRSVIEPMAGGNIWEKPQEYISNSAILFADRVTSPLLIFHCKEDGSVPFEQAIEMFLSLQRLDKRVWLLDYDNGGHVLLDESDKEDLTIRINEYFDHYLKHAPAPKWMTQGVPAALKGIESRYELDPANSCGKDCKVCKEWNKKMKKDSTATMAEIQEKTKTEHWMAVDGIYSLAPAGLPL